MEIKRDRNIQRLLKISKRIKFRTKKKISSKKWIGMVNQTIRIKVRVIILVLLKMIKMISGDNNSLVIEAIKKKKERVIIVGKQVT